MQKKNIFDLYNEQHKDDGKEVDKLPGEVTAADVEPEQEAAPETEQKQEPEQPTPEPEQKEQEGGKEDGV